MTCSRWLRPNRLVFIVTSIYCLLLLWPKVHSLEVRLRSSGVRNDVEEGRSDGITTENPGDDFLFMNPKPGEFLIPVNFPAAKTVFKFKLHDPISTLTLKLADFCFYHSLYEGHCRFFSRFIFRVYKQAEVITNGFSYYAPKSKFLYLEEDSEREGESVDTDGSDGVVLVAGADASQPIKHLKVNHQIPYGQLKRHDTALVSEYENADRNLRMYKANQLMEIERTILEHLKAFIDKSYEEEKQRYIRWLQQEDEKQMQTSPQKRPYWYRQRTYRYYRSNRHPNAPPVPFPPLPPLSRIAVIHSCLLPGMTYDNDTRILSELLDRINATPSLKIQLSRIFVFHYGEPLTSIRASDKYPDVNFIEMSRDISFFEVPTVRLLHAMAQYIYGKYGPPNTKPSSTVSRDENGTLIPHIPIADTQFLYMHTKGVSYKEMYYSIEEWRDTMLYYNIDRHHHAYHMLQSDAYDVMGLTFHRVPRLVIGNYWWSKISYLNKLLPLQYETADKYSAEAWLLSGSSRVRFYSSHFSGRDQAVARYPRYCYTSTFSESLPLPDLPPSTSSEVPMVADPAGGGKFPNYEQWIAVCGANMSMTYYKHMHRIPMVLPLSTATDTEFSSSESHSSQKMPKKKNDDFVCVGQIFGNAPKDE